MAITDTVIAVATGLRSKRWRLSLATALCCQSSLSIAEGWGLVCLARAWGPLVMIDRP